MPAGGLVLVLQLTHVRTRENYQYSELLIQVVDSYISAALVRSGLEQARSDKMDRGASDKMSPTDSSTARMMEGDKVKMEEACCAETVRGQF